MRIERGQQIAGFDVFWLRDRLRSIHDGVSVGHFVDQRSDEELVAFLLRAKLVVDRLIEAGLIHEENRYPSYWDLNETEAQRLVAAGVLMPSERGFDHGLYCTTGEGAQLASALARKPVKRATAQRRLEELIERVHQANADGDWLDDVDEVRLFGSMLDESRTEVGDVDIALVMNRRDIDGDSVELAMAWNQRHDDHPASFIQALFNPTHRLQQFVRGKGSTIQLTTSRNLEALDTSWRTIYQRDSRR